jgi:hypothetical protein
MNRKLLLLLAGLFTATLTHAQDNIVLKNGTEIRAKVLEVSATEIKYRKQDNPDGPVYSSGIGEVLLINYANGTKDVLGRSSPGISPAGQASLSAPLLSPTTPARLMNIDGLRYEGGWFSRRFTTALGQTLPKREVRSLLLAQPDAMQAFNQGSSLRRWTYITGGAAVLLVGAGAAVAAFGDGGFGQDGNRMGENDATSATDNDGPNGTGNNNDRNGGDGAAIVGAAVAGTGVLVGVAALILDHRGTRAFRRAADRYHAQPATSLHLTPGYRGTGIGLALRF